MRLSNKLIVCVAALISSTSLSVSAQDVYSELDFALGDSATKDASTEPTRWRGFLGDSIGLRTDPVTDMRWFRAPLISVSYNDTVYLRSGQAGAWLLKSADRSVRVGVAVKLRGGYDPEDDVDSLAGMDRRDTSVEAGVRGIWRTRPVIVSFGIYTDVSDNSNGNSALLGLSHPFRLSESWSLVPSLGAEWLSTEVVDYYYGVKPSEATASRPAYAGQSAVNLRAALMAHYKLTRAWFLFGGASVTHLGSGIADSPIVSEEKVAAVFVGGGWRF